MNIAILYDPQGIRSLGTISDVKFHRAESTWASLEKLFKNVDFSDTQTLYIVSDSPTSQYRNKKNVFLTKNFAIDNGISVYWIFTETGHGKGPMDGVGSAIKRVVKDVIAFNPNKIISNTNELMEYLPPMPNVVVETYTEEDVKRIQEHLPSKIELFPPKRISEVHEIFIAAQIIKS